MAESHFVDLHLFLMEVLPRLLWPAAKDQNSSVLQSLPANHYHAVIMSLVLSYLPTPQKRMDIINQKYLKHLLKRFTQFSIILNLLGNFILVFLLGLIIIYLTNPII